MDEDLIERLHQLAGSDLDEPLTNILATLAQAVANPRNPENPLTLREELNQAALLWRRLHGNDALQKSRELADRVQTTFARGVVSTLEWILRAEERQAELDRHAILDTFPETTFDDIAFIAAHACKVPFAAINFIAKDRQWAKALHGGEERTLALNESVCGLVIDDPEVVVISDLSKHGSTAGLKAVTVEGMSFYASAPIRTKAGVIVGRLCVVDYHPRSCGLDDAQTNVLQALARQVTAYLELQRLQNSDG